MPKKVLQDMGALDPTVGCPRDALDVWRVTGLLACAVKHKMT